MTDESYKIGQKGEQLFRKLANQFGLRVRMKRLMAKNGRCIQAPGPDFWCGFGYTTPVEVKTVRWRGEGRQAIMMRHFQKQGSIHEDPSPQVRILLERNGWVFYAFVGLKTGRLKTTPYLIPWSVLWDRMHDKKIKGIKGLELLDGGPLQKYIVERSTCQRLGLPYGWQFAEIARQSVVDGGLSAFIEMANLARESSASDEEVSLWSWLISAMETTQEALQ